MSRFTQFLAYPVVWFFSKIFVPVELQNPSGLSVLPKGPLVIIANHISSYDSFLLRMVTNWKTLPIRFMGVTKFHRLYLRLLRDFGIIHFTYFLFGVFKIVPGRGIQKNLVTAKKIIARGGKVLIFPEGSINTSGQLNPFKRGAAMLALQTGAPVLPITFSTPLPGDDSKTIISIGKPIILAKGTAVEDATATFYSTIQTMLREAKKTAMQMQTTTAIRKPVAGSIRA